MGWRQSDSRKKRGYFIISIEVFLISYVPAPIAAIPMRNVIRARRVVIDQMVLAINATEKRGCYMEILAVLKAQMDAFLFHHARMLFVRLDIRHHTYTDDNKAMSDYMRKLIKHLKRKYKVTRIGYIWVREME